MKKKELKFQLKAMTEELNETQQKLNSANRLIKILIKMQIDHIEMLNRQLEQQDKAIERKDAQWLGLRMAFQDALINNQA